MYQRLLIFVKTTTLVHRILILHWLLFLMEISLTHNLILVLNTHIIKSSPPLVQLLVVNIGRCYGIIDYILHAVPLTIPVTNLC